MINLVQTLNNIGINYLSEMYKHYVDPIQFVPHEDLIS